jgi:hypothetical protein
VTRPFAWRAGWTYELTDLRGLACALHDALLLDLPQHRALLTTYRDDRPAPRLYRRLGWSLLCEASSTTATSGGSSCGTATDCREPPRRWFGLLLS